MEFYENHGKLLNDSIYMICDISIKYIGIASIILQCLFLTFIERLLDTLKKNLKSLFTQSIFNLISNMKLNYMFIILLFSILSLIYCDIVLTTEEYNAFNELNNLYFEGAWDMEDICSNPEISCFLHDEEDVYSL